MFLITYRINSIIKWINIIRRIYRLTDIFSLLVIEVSSDFENSNQFFHIDSSSNNRDHFNRNIVIRSQEYIDNPQLQNIEFEDTLENSFITHHLKVVKSVSKCWRYRIQYSYRTFSTKATFVKIFCEKRISSSKKEFLKWIFCKQQLRWYSFERSKRISDLMST